MSNSHCPLYQVTIVNKYKHSNSTEKTVSGCSTLDCSCIQFAICVYVCVVYLLFSATVQIILTISSLLCKVAVVFFIPFTQKYKSDDLIFYSQTEYVNQTLIHSENLLRCCHCEIDDQISSLCSTIYNTH